jgi:hypothetical protein
MSLISEVMMSLIEREREPGQKENTCDCPHCGKRVKATYYPNPGGIELEPYETVDGDPSKGV